MSRVLRSHTRPQGEVPNNQRRRQEQAAILEKLQSEDNRQRTSVLANKRDVTVAGQLARNKIVAYTNEESLKQLQNTLQFDAEKGALIVPMAQQGLVPFHVSTIKSITKQEESGFSILRINFNVPGITSASGYSPAAIFPKATFVKDISYRMKNAERAQRLVDSVTAAVKDVKAKEKMRDISQDQTQSGSLVVSGAPTARLPQVIVRPNPLARARQRVQGHLEAHQNGFRFIIPQSKPVDILYSNVKRAFFMPSDNDLLVIIHFNLIKPILIKDGKSKINDIQFFAEVMNEGEAITTLNTRKENIELETAAEEKQRDFQRKLNSEFHKFVRAVESAGNLKFERPVRNGEFNGTPLNVKASVTIRPTEHNLAAVNEPPFWVLHLEEIEVAALERVTVGNKNFDMVFIMKDYTQPVQRLDVVDWEALDDLEEWLTSKGIKYYELKDSVNWDLVMKQVKKDDLEGYWDPWHNETGWPAILDVERADTDEESSASSEVDWDDVSGSSDGSSSGSWMSADEESSEQSSGSGSDDDEGLEWDELERRAAESDRKKGDRFGEDSDDDQPKKKKQATGAGARPVASSARPGAPVARPGAPVARPGPGAPVRR